MPDANTKYASAQNEINARIQTRDRVLLAFISLTSVLVGIALSRDDLAFTAIGVGYVALGTTLINLQHELVIGYLATFQRRIAKVDGLGSDTPEWVSDEYIARRLLARHIRNIAQILFILFGAVPSLFIATRSLKSPLSFETFLWYGSLICSALAMLIVIWIGYSRSTLIRSE